jgi:hypothetical protein
LRDAILRTRQAAEIAGIRAILVHVISEKAKQFYESCGFNISPMEPMTLMITIADVKNSWESTTNSKTNIKGNAHLSRFCNGFRVN